MLGSLIKQFEEQKPELPVHRMLVLRFSVTTKNGGTPEYCADDSDPRFAGFLETDGASLPVLKRNGRAIDVLVPAGFVILQSDATQLSQKKMDFDFAAKLAVRHMVEVFPDLQFSNPRRVKFTINELVARARADLKNIGKRSPESGKSLEYEVH